MEQEKPWKSQANEDTLPKPWWENEPCCEYDWVYSYGKPIYDIDKVVAEATRRGEKRAWEEARHILRNESQSFCSVGMPKDAIDSARRSGFSAGLAGLCKAMEKRILEKLSSLTNKKEV